MRVLLDLAQPLVYHGMRLLFGGAAQAYYSSLHVRHAERIPLRGPLIIAANHPASLTDVLVLGAILPRRVHFVAYSGLFRPWLLGFVLRLAGTIPVYRQQEGADQMHRNEDMFRACNAVLAAGGAVLIFPEGTSMSDRRVEQLKTGTARMALAYESGAARGAPLTLLPVGVHFEDRTRFQSRVTLSVGRPVDLAAVAATYATDPREAVLQVTSQLQVALEKLILNIPAQELARLVRDVERIYVPVLRKRLPEVPEITLGRGIAECVEFYRRHDREGLHHLWMAVDRYQRLLRAVSVRLPQDARRHIAPNASQLIPQALLGALPAMVGGLVHVVPYQLSGSLGRLFSQDPTRISFARMMSGVVLFPAMYAGIGWWLWRGRDWSGWSVLLAWAACALLGIFSLGYFRWLRRERDRLRLMWLVWTKPRMVARLRREQRTLIRLLDQARDRFLTWMAGEREGPAGFE